MRLRIMTDRLLIRSLMVETRLGVHDWERAKPQAVWVDLELAIDAARAAASDDVRHTVDYGQLASRIRLLTQEKTYRLLETMAEDIAGLVTEEFAVPEAVVRVTKRTLPGLEAAAVEVTRRRRPVKSAGTSRRSGRSPTAARR